MNRLKKTNWLYLVFSFIIAVLLWFFVISELNPVTEVSFRNLDIQIVNSDQLTSNGLVITSGANTTATVKVQGKRDKIALVKAGKFTLTASVASISAPGTYNLNYTISVDVPDVSVVSENPSQVSITVERVASKTIPIEVNFTGNMPADYFIESFSLSKDAVVLTGAKSAIDSVKTAVLKYDISAVKSSVSTTLEYSLLDEKGKTANAEDISVDIKAVTLNLNVKVQKQLPLRVNFISSEYFSEEMIEYAIEPQEITVSADPETANYYNSIVLGTENLKSFKTSEMESALFDIILPDGLTSDDGIQKAKLTVKTPDHERKKITVASDYFAKSDDYVFNPLSAVKVDVFGPKTIVDVLDARDFNVEIDYVKTDTETGVITAYLKVSCASSDIVIFGTYSVVVEEVEITDVTEIGDITPEEPAFPEEEI